MSTQSCYQFSSSIVALSPAHSLLSKNPTLWIKYVRRKFLNCLFSQKCFWSVWILLSLLPKRLEGTGATLKVSEEKINLFPDGLSASSIFQKSRLRSLPPIPVKSPRPHGISMCVPNSPLQVQNYFICEELWKPSSPRVLSPTPWSRADAQTHSAMLQGWIFQNIWTPAPITDHLHYDFFLCYLTGISLRAICIHCPSSYPFTSPKMSIHLLYTLPPASWRQVLLWIFSSTSWTKPAPWASPYTSGAPAPTILSLDWVSGDHLYCTTALHRQPDKYHVEGNHHAPTC